MAGRCFVGAAATICGRWYGVIAGDNTAAGRRGYDSEVDEENYRRVAAGEDI
jgi:hypothetical protein